MRSRTSALCGRCRRLWCLTVIFSVKLYDKICGLQIDFSEFYSVNSQKTVPLNDLEVHQIKAPSIGQSSHGRAIKTALLRKILWSEKFQIISDQIIQNSDLRSDQDQLFEKWSEIRSRSPKSWSFDLIWSDSRSDQPYSGVGIYSRQSNKYWRENVFWLFSLL